MDRYFSFGLFVYRFFYMEEKLVFMLGYIFYVFESYLVLGIIIVCCFILFRFRIVCFYFLFSKCLRLL